ncbi:MAG: FAD-dependent oxidoreductase [Betaproteobacteria bacterium]|nr:FAD-dependent oxidoreductase [Betaproteobacteria bacterium]
MSATLHADVAVIGASLGGVLAALTAAKAGRTVVLTAEHAWLGGQMTAQGVPPDEHRLIESGGASESYLAFRRAMRAVYANDAAFSDRATLTEGLNPGDGWVSRLCFEPRHAARWFEEQLAPHAASGRLHVLRGHRLVRAERDGRRLRSVDVADKTDAPRHLTARYFIDATDTGELIAATGLPYRLGKEARSEFDEPHAPETADPLDQQPVTWVVALRRDRAPHAVGAPPEDYAFWRAQRVPHFGHALFSASMPGEQGASARLPFFAAGDTLDWWRYRRIVAGHQWTPPRAEVSLVNWAQNDYALSPLLDGPLPAREVGAAARRLSACWVHWLRTEAPRHDGAGTGYAELAPDAALGGEDGFAEAVYVRESRRLIGLDTLAEGAIAHAGGAWLPATHPDSVGIGWYNMDIHPTCRSGLGSNAKVRPFELPIGLWLARDCDNLLPGCKNLSVTHLVSAATRVHPVEWLAGEVAGLLAAHACQSVDEAPLANIRKDRAAFEAFRARLKNAGVAWRWPDPLIESLNRTQA